MSLARKAPADGLFRHLAAETNESAAVGLFLDLCRSSPALRHWLWEDFARDATKRDHFARVLKSTATAARFADLVGESDAWREEARRLRAKLPRRPYGSLTFDEIKELVMHYQAGKTHIGAFLFALEWQRLRPAGPAPVLVRGAFRVLDAAMADGTDLLHQLAKARDLARDFTSGPGRRATVGYSDWWKLNTLLYVMRHPASGYAAREVQAHLAGLGLKVSTRDVRRFFAHCGIKRDVRAGRPGKTPRKPIAPTAKRPRPAARTRPAV